MTTSDTCYRLVVAGRLSQTVTQLIDSRFGSAASIGRRGPDSAVDLTADQPALRALLTLLWDLGHDLVAICECADQTQPVEGLLSAHRAVDPRTPSGLDPAVLESADLRKEHTP
jgi:hypothetical protein